MLRSNDAQPTSIPFPRPELGTGEEMIRVLPMYKNGMLIVFYNDAYCNKAKTDVDDLFFISELDEMETTS